MIVVDGFDTVLVEHYEDFAIAVGGDHAISILIGALLLLFLLHAQVIITVTVIVINIINIRIYQPNDIMIHRHVIMLGFLLADLWPLRQFQQRLMYNHS